jgi:4-amino-4-deoxy-L-arabinose transferase-like glycosyltransferase
VLPRVTLRGAASALLVAGVCALPLLLYAPFYAEPFMRDEGLYATVAQIMKHGGIPYQDHFDNKPPMIFGWYYVSFALFGEHVWAPRLLVALLLSLTTLLVYVQGRLLFSRGYAMLAATAFGLSTGIVRLQLSANTESFMLLPLVAGLVSFTMGQKSGSWWWYALSGLFSGLAIATKDISLFAYFFLIAFAGWSHVRKTGLRALSLPEFRRSVGGLIVGCLVAFILVVVPFAATGAMPELFETTVVYTLKYVGGPSTGTKLSALLTLPLFLAFVLGPWFVLSIIGLFRRPDTADDHRLLLGGWFAANLLGIIIAGRFYNHYFAALLPCAALMVPLGVSYVADNWRSLRQPRFVALTATLILVLPLLTAVQFAQNASIFLKSTPEARHEAKYAGDDRAAWENEGPQLGAWLQERTRPDELIYNFGFQSEVYFYADRRPASRFLFDRPFWYADSYVDEAIAELAAKRPSYVVDSAIYEEWAEGKVYTQRIKDWIVQNYDYVGKVYYADVWRLKAVEE